MKKKVIGIIFAVILGLSMLAFVGCGGSEFDPTELLDRIEQLERDLEEARELNGLPGQPGQTPHIGGNGNWWIGSTDTGVRAEGQDGNHGNHGQTPQIIGGYWWVGGANTGIPATGPQGSTGPAWQPELNKVYELGQTFTYYSHTGLRLFSIKVEYHSAIRVRVFVTNHNMPGYGVHNFVRMRAASGATTFMTDSFNDPPFSNPLPIGTTNTVNGLSLSFSSTYADYAWFGWPTNITANSMIPYAVFRL